MNRARLLIVLCLVAQGLLWGWAMLDAGPMPATARHYFLFLSLTPLGVAAAQGLRGRWGAGLAVLYGGGSALMLGMLAAVSVDPDDLAAGGPYWTVERVLLSVAALLSVVVALLGCVGFRALHGRTGRPTFRV